MWYTAEDVQNLEFSYAPFGRRGYAKNEVDRFVSRIARTLSGASSPQEAVSVVDIDRIRFGRPLIGKRGYDERQVDEFLDTMAKQLVPRSCTAPRRVVRR